MSHEDTKISKGCATGGKVIPIILETSIVKTSFPPECLWPLNGDAKYAAEKLCQRLVNEKATGTAARQLETTSMFFSDVASLPSQPHIVHLPILKHLGHDLVYLDKIKWDLNSPVYLADVYASRVAQDLNLGSHAAILIAHDIKSKIHKARNEVATSSSTMKILERTDLTSKKGRELRVPLLLSGEEAKRMLKKIKHESDDKEGGDIEEKSPLASTPTVHEKEIN